MRRSAFAGGLFLALAVVIVGCDSGSAEDTLMQQNLSLIEEMASIMEGVKDAKTMQDAQTKLEAKWNKVDESAKKIDELKLTDAQRKSMKDRWDSKTQAAVTRLEKAEQEARKKIGG